MMAPSTRPLQVTLALLLLLFLVVYIAIDRFAVELVQTATKASHEASIERLELTVDMLSHLQSTLDDESNEQQLLSRFLASTVASKDVSGAAEISRNQGVSQTYALSEAIAEREQIHRRLQQFWSTSASRQCWLDEPVEQHQGPRPFCLLRLDEKRTGLVVGHPVRLVGGLSKLEGLLLPLRALVGVFFIASLLYFFRLLLRPTRSLVQRAEKVWERWGDERQPGSNRDLQFVVQTFDHAIQKLESKEARLRDSMEELEEKAALKERLAEIGELTAGVAHEFRNPLSTITGYAQLLVRKLDKETEGVDRNQLSAYAEKILQESAELESVMRAFLDFAAPMSGEREVVEVAELLRSSLASIRGRAEELGIELALELPSNREDPPICVHGNPSTLIRAFTNLLSNAIEAIDAKLRATTDEQLQITPRIDVRLRRKEGHAVMHIEDMGGGGISDDLRGSLFSPFVTGRETGTGLGLALVAKIARTHGGDVRLVRSSPRGSLFEVRLPAAECDS